MQAKKGFIWTQASTSYLVWMDRWNPNESGFTKSDVDLNLYHKVVNDDPLVLVQYVDDLLYGVRRNSPLSS